jgi:hypothetical protein
MFTDNWKKILFLNKELINTMSALKRSEQYKIKHFPCLYSANFCYVLCRSVTIQQYKFLSQIYFSIHWKVKGKQKLIISTILSSNKIWPVLCSQNYYTQWLFILKHSPENEYNSINIQYLCGRVLVMCVYRHAPLNCIENLSSNVNKSTVMDVAEGDVTVASKICDHIWKIGKIKLNKLRSRNRWV